MAQKAIREADGKAMMARLLTDYTDGKYKIQNRFVSVGPETELKKLPNKYKWLQKEKLVVKPDQLIKRRGKSKLLLLNVDWKEAEKWIRERMNKPITVGTVTGILDHFIVEPFVPHDEKDEYYVAITAQREGDAVLFHHEGGINVGDVDAKAVKLFVPIGETPTAREIETKLLGNVPKERKALIAEFIEGLFKYYADLNYSYLEINPFVVDGEGVTPLDLAAKLDDTADFVSANKWGAIDLPAPFGRMMTREEAYIEELDSKTGASLKLTVLNPEGRVWTMVAGGGASVIYADTITDLGFMEEMANYGEYSGDPNEEFTYLYARTILDLMTRKKNTKGKFLLIGGGIANFTDVANTFRGIIRALREYKKKLQENKVKIYVRRGGPNYKEGLNQMRALGDELGVTIEVYGPETHMTKIVSMALKGDK
ncbi:MAG: ATPase [Deltaproteobacteria bacterium]|nr:ATPase [Deltaproteobacteria bacterium]MBN2687419.1 ATPase [Deltaproteobacteria bacterium]